MTKKPMTIERAIEIVKWGVYAEPKIRTEAEKREAYRMVLNTPDVWDQILWGYKS